MGNVSQRKFQFPQLWWRHVRVSRRRTWSQRMPEQLDPIISYLQGVTQSFLTLLPRNINWQLKARSSQKTQMEFRANFRIENGTTSKVRPSIERDKIWLSMRNTSRRDFFSKFEALERISRHQERKVLRLGENMEKLDKLPTSWRISSPEEIKKDKLPSRIKWWQEGIKFPYLDNFLTQIGEFKEDIQHVEVAPRHFPTNQIAPSQHVQVRWTWLIQKLLEGHTSQCNNLLFSLMVHI